MKALIQRVLSSKLEINKKEYSKIERGFLVLLGITHDDTEEDMKALAEKIVKLRIFTQKNARLHKNSIYVHETGHTAPVENINFINQKQ